MTIPTVARTAAKIVPINGLSDMPPCELCDNAILPEDKEWKTKISLPRRPEIDSVLADLCYACRTLAEEDRDILKLV